MRAATRWRMVSVQRALAVLTVAFAASCGTQTSTTHVWQAEAPSTPIRSVIVFGGGTTEATRRSLEDRFAQELAARGVDARPSYQIFPELPDRERARAEVQRLGFQGALVTTLRDVRQETRYLPGYYQGGFWGAYYGPGWGMPYTPGYVATDELVIVENTFWDLRTNGGQLVWSSNTETHNPTSTKDFVESLTREVVSKLAKKGLLPRR